MSKPQESTEKIQTVGDFLPINGIDHIEFYVGNAKQAQHFYRQVLGFSLVAYAGLETGIRDRASYVLEQGKIRFVLTTPLAPEHPISEHLRLHGDGVKDIALWVDDALQAFAETTKRGARAAYEPVVLKDEFGGVKKSAIFTYGETFHSFVERKNYKGPFLPGYQPVPQPDKLTRPVGLNFIDHVVGNVGWNEMNKFVDFYERVMGFRLFKHFDDKDISTEYSALMSKVVTSGNGRIKFPINEPAEGKKKSQIEEYLDYYKTPGVQHIAMASDNIIETVRLLTMQGLDFLYVPTTYYDDLQKRVGKIDEPVEELAKLGILVDRDDEGYLLQIFTKPVEDRPTLFFEVIQRKGSKSFGKGNFKALFESIEREQARRGNL